MADDNIRHVNCASDFRIVFAFSDGKLPDYPWRLGLKTPNTPSYNMYVASFDGTTYNNCSPLDDESIMVFVDHHRLVPGILHYYLQTDAPDSLFPDGEMNITIPGTVNIVLWEGPSDGDTPPEVTVIVERLLKGDKGDPGDPGEAGQITFATASIDNTTGTPSVKIELGGTPEKRTIDFKFSGLKGEPGEPDESFVRYDEAQSLTTSEQAQAFANLGMKVYVTDSSFLGSTLSAEELEQVVDSKALLFTDTGDLFLLGRLTSGQITFTRPNTNFIISIITITKSTGGVSDLTNYNYQDALALHFTVQNPALTSAQQSQAFANLGWKVHVISESAIGSSDAVSDDEKAARLSATALLVQETGEMYIYGHNSTSTPSERRFYRFRDTKTLALLNVVTTTGLITQPPFVNIYDENAVSFNIDQSGVSDDRKNKALGNIGLDFVRIPYSLLGTTLSDEMYAVVDNARGIILVDTPSGYEHSTVYIKGRNVFTATLFMSMEGSRSMSYISVDNILKTIGNVTMDTTYTGSVRYSEIQNLTNTQKDTALSNIGLDFVHVDYSLFNTTLSDADFNRIWNAEGLIIVGNNEVAPVMLKGRSSLSQVTFYSIRDSSTLVYTVLLDSTKRLNGLTSWSFNEGAVQYNVAQNLTDAQKQQARSNIGVQSADELLADDNFIAQLKTKLGIG